MKHYLVLFTLMLATILPVQAQEQLLSPPKTAKGRNVEVNYGQPSKRNRVIFGELVPYGQVWRTGANEATEITFKKNGTFAGKPVKAGTYTLFTIPKEKEWDIILNGVLHQWGAYEYEKIKGKNVLVATVPVMQLDEVQEKLTYEVKDNALNIKWDETGVSIPMQFQ